VIDDRKDASSEKLPRSGLVQQQLYDTTLAKGPDTFYLVS